ncbi:4-hydroxythreonine-4-phosphate dehydrogenase PdxA [Synoicihabitans lomoniglobus]|uniref:4-hydroxythreonine-4-phosphate dehydrogenase PdxA n=1 Tax=Synoicihabitans lomoniglobus TaxID=2909285 RepID=A0AAF0CMI8_9BACT|nr:4-hydroxythreonine-4-phosphate dehydrogenase PdxA [Opitutaceae bacterium LMO-M01]WED63095.1 4-hydroxythreonine-4-phosphate dehydrogenase PdxA [Opitutaceae bacterium LMO-M01]
MTSAIRPLLGITSGDPAGIGPEITVKALQQPEVHAHCRPLVIGDAGVMRQIAATIDRDLIIHVVSDPRNGRYERGTIDVLDLGNVDPAKFRYNTVAAMTGQASFDYVVKAIELAMAGQIDATVTGPIHKEALRAAGQNFAGHTEIYAHYTRTRDYTMMLAEGGFRVVHVSTHVALAEAIRRVTTERVLKVIHLAHDALRQMAIEAPRIAVAGLNPHAGENGLFGREEIDHIMPAIAAAQAAGIDATGPFPPDTIFPKMKGGQFDVVVCMYHDQGHIPTKLLGFDYDHASGEWKSMAGVNITLGLPIIRVSVDHGVAFDRAGQGTANPGSMIEAISYATRLAQQS